MVNQSSFRSKSFHVVIDEYDKLNDIHITEQQLFNYLKDELRFKFYAFIKHDKDLDEVGNLKYVHYHLIVICNQAYSKNTIIGCIARGLFVNIDIVQVRRMDNFVKSIQYLIHKNDKEKYQYDLIDIWCNDLNELHQCILENSSSYDMDMDSLILLVKSSDSLTQIYKILGLEKSKKFRSIITDLWKEEHPYGY